jgi:4-hydroxythreonine-4-phosphate dehydrogenase
MNRPLVAVTMGDPAGIGPEICLRLLQHERTIERCVPVVFGDAEVLRRVADQCGLVMPEHVISLADWLTASYTLNSPAVLDMGVIAADEVIPGSVDATTGAASYEYIATAIEAAIAGEVEAIATGPIHKEALHAAGVMYPGHTEILAAMTNSERTCMMLTSSEVTCSLVTTHVGLRYVPAMLSVERILEVIELSHDAMRRIRGREPRLAVCGLNPHAGEHGLFGDQEEERIITPAIYAARSKGIQIEGPLPPDTAFLPNRRLATDCYICMYHDQGLIPLKTLAFDEAVNVTLGLPIVRTSVDHGTALDIAWQGEASATSLIQAVDLAVQLTQTKSAASQLG